jgi:5-methyltetrahydropteroyltriglutamate--homocysteine methyltransferase
MQSWRHRAHHIGSFLRPPRLHAARANFAAGTIGAPALRAVEDECIRDAVALQERLGFHFVTDGEFRRMSWRSILIERVPGFATADAIGNVDHAQDGMGGTVAIGNAPYVTRPIDVDTPVAIDDAEFLLANTRAAAKIALPSPSYMHFLRGDASFSRDAYPDRQAFFSALVSLYRNEIARLAERGVKMVQLDEVAVTAMCDPNIRAKLSARGDSPDDLVNDYTAAVAAILARKPAGLTMGIHMCRGNFSGKWLASGGYGYLRSSFLGKLVPDLWLLEFDSERAGDFGILADINKASSVILGLVSTKSAVMEDRATVMKRLGEAARIMPIERLGISPQCGFASHVAGNPISPEIQEQKLKLVMDVAREVWGMA